ncbi:hypothetical protein [Spirilliplanes yamanashiensis]|uniref:Uncharacterized protein n=1 Tax=Spirilliplanes yamanashiensis TaxID=42233 RepID=A0A8J4DIG2_9ACTN|nr:hypothetical protein [Spirilliplanes yamanashiensis]MDP9817291.1 hypothetical protein [Spirilliplanes yamanashiensis]GIJ03057.1 hypothetical protein Sya03_24090 [Spirilliplanes yamanashiensis]
MFALHNSQAQRRQDIAGHTVGNAMVLHLENSISAEARALAMNVAQDDQNDIVVLDVAGDLPAELWESVARALPRRRRRGVRLVVCGRYRSSSTLVGPWLAQRLRRTVVAAHGDVLPGASGSLFVHPGPQTGWVRYRPGKPGAWDAKRFPTPAWDGALTADYATSSTGVAEPLPAGAWIHHAGAGDAVRAAREWLVSSVPCQPDVLLVLLGCPGTPPVALDDVLRFWRTLDETHRRMVRFAAYGPVALPPGETPGRALADLLGEPVVCLTGVPLGEPAKPDVYTIATDGRLGWNAFVREVGYAPRERPTAQPPAPVMLSYRTPEFFGRSVGGPVFWYAADAVIEVIQGGLWIRPPEAPRHAPRIRAARLDPDRSAVVFDDANEQQAARMRVLAQDVIDRLDPATREHSVLVQASALAEAMADATGPGQAPAGGRLGEEPAAPAEEAALPVAAVEPATAEALGQRAPSIGALETLRVGVRPGQAQGVLAPDTGPEPAPEPVGPPASPAPPRAPAEPAAPLPAPPPTPAPAPPAAPAPVPAPAPVLPPAPAQPVAAAPSIIPPAAPPTAPLAVPPAAPGAPGAAPKPAPGGAPVAPRTPAVDVAAPADPPAAGGGAPRLQQAPVRAASALIPGRGLGEERAWLRRSLNTEFTALSTAVTRVLSQHPGLKRAADTDPDEVLTDSVAVRLYLSPAGSAIDAGLRAARKGPHVPFARCVVAGLVRLPSHRGATVYTASPSAQQWRLVTERKVVTEWGFLNALTEPGPQTGTVDVLIWAMTARRTRILEPDGAGHADNRVLFVPGTSFKVLEAVAPGPGTRGRLFLRELAANEIDEAGKVAEDRLQLDELAAGSLRRCAERWAESAPASVVGEDALARFGALPGLTG